MSEKEHTAAPAHWEVAIRSIKIRYVKKNVIRKTTHKSLLLLTPTVILVPPAE